MTQTATNERCPYCGSPVEFADNSVVYGRQYGQGKVWVCSMFPICDAYVGCHPDGRPLGTLARGDVRRARVRAHRAFDRLWRGVSGTTRGGAYRKLANHLGVEAIHIGESDVATCRRIIEYAEREAAKLPQATERSQDG